jgi:hypothetical protein
LAGGESGKQPRLAMLVRAEMENKEIFKQDNRKDYFLEMFEIDIICSSNSNCILDSDEIWVKYLPGRNIYICSTYVI